MATTFFPFPYGLVLPKKYERNNLQELDFAIKFFVVILCANVIWIDYRRSADGSTEEEWKIDERNGIFVVKSVKSMIKNPSKKSQITIFKHSKYRMKVQFWCENWPLVFKLCKDN